MIEQLRSIPATYIHILPLYSRREEIVTKDKRSRL